MLLGRQPERHAIDAALSQARTGASATLALIGEPGIGKTALLDYAAEQAAGMRLLRARGIESEAQIPFASLLELVRPALGMLARIPASQSVVLEGALALRPAISQERFAVGAATLSLLAAYADQAPVAVLVDDAHWLDGSSAQALLFAFRRLMADSIAVLVAVREGEPSLLDGADISRIELSGLSRDDAAALLPGLPPSTARQLHDATAGNPLALLELASDVDDLVLAPEGAPLLISDNISGAFLRRAEGLEDSARDALALAATSDTGDLATLTRAATTLSIDLSALTAAESAGLITLRAGIVEFRHPLARSAIYAGTPAEQRRAAHRALAGALPDRDVDRRAWHLATAAVGADETASAALEQAGGRGLDRSAYATAAAAFERAARLAVDPERRASLLLRAADAAWHAGLAELAGTLLEHARPSTGDAAKLLDIDHLAGRIAVRRGPVMRGYEILSASAKRAAPELAVAMLCEAVYAGFAAGNPEQMRIAAEGAQHALPNVASVRDRFLTATALGMARILGGDAAAGAEAMHQAVELAESSAALRTDLQLLPWLPLGPLFLRESDAGRPLLEYALATARERAALGVLPFVLNLLARDEAATDRWAIAEATYREAIALGRETGQETDVVFGLSGLAFLLARRGREDECRTCASEALQRSQELGTRLFEVWATAALGELDLGLGDASAAAAHLEHQQDLLVDLGITDVDLSPAAELVDAYVRLGRAAEAQQLTRTLADRAVAKGQPWSRARALRCEGLIAADAEIECPFELALEQHVETPDVFEQARTRLAYGERLRRARNRVRARKQLRQALDTFERLDARPWADRARAELAASGETLRRRDPSSIDELTPQELQIALHLASGKTTRETAAAVFLSPKTVEYHLRHVYQKLGIHSREELADALPRDPAPRSGARASSPSG